MTSLRNFWGIPQAILTGEIAILRTKIPSVWVLLECFPHHFGVCSSSLTLSSFVLACLVLLHRFGVPEGVLSLDCRLKRCRRFPGNFPGIPVARSAEDL